MNRLIARGDKEEVLTLRINSEIEEFTEFYKSGTYDCLIDNNGTLEDLFNKVDSFLER